VALKAYRLCGSRVEEGLAIADGRLEADSDRGPALLAAWLGDARDDDGATLPAVRAGLAPDGAVVLAPAGGDEPVRTDAELVLVHEYSPGCGAKRWPSFHVDWDQAGGVRILARVERMRGSGSDSRTLVMAPAGWARNLAGQFIDERDWPGQMVAYQPDLARPAPAPGAAPPAPVAPAAPATMEALRARFGRR
jgi:hypothetical protein